VKAKSEVEQADQAQTAQNALGFSLLFSGVRCVLQYAVLPFVLPIVGIAADVTVPLLLAINVLAMVSVVFSLRRFWKIRYAHRWTYLIVAVAALTLLTVFLWLDIRALYLAG
jgi:hypothetical protein